MATTTTTKQINVTFLTKTTIHIALLLIILLLVSSLPPLFAAAALPPSPPHLPAAGATSASGSQITGGGISSSVSKVIGGAGSNIIAAGSKFIGGAPSGSGSNIIGGAGSKIIAAGSKIIAAGSKIIGGAGSKFIGGATAGSRNKTIAGGGAAGSKIIASASGNKTIAAAGNKTIAGAATSSGSKIIGDLLDILILRRRPSPQPPPPPPPEKMKKKNPEAREFLISHNLVRSTHGVSPLRWSPSLARYARRWSEHRRGDCAMEHSLGPYGENMFWGSGAGGGCRAGDAVASWASERSFYNESDNECLPGRSCGHFTQIVWGSSERLGCGRAECVAGAGVIITCVYDPPGNFVGEGPL